MSKKHFVMPRLPKQTKHRPDAIEWHGTPHSTAARLTAISSDRLLIENHLTISEFSSERIEVLTAEGPLVISGNALFIEDLRQKQLTVRGQIQNVALPNGGDAI